MYSILNLDFKKTKIYRNYSFFLFERINQILSNSISSIHKKNISKNTSYKTYKNEPVLIKNKSRFKRYENKSNKAGELEVDNYFYELPILNYFQNLKKKNSVSKRFKKLMRAVLKENTTRI